MNNPHSTTDNTFERFCEIISDDLFLLARLHAAELDDELIVQLKAMQFPTGFGLLLPGEQTRKIIDTCASTIQSWPDHLPAEIQDQLVVDFAALYLNHSYRASPQESVWIDEENLAMQEPMFEVRKWYQRYGLETENWRVRPDDHLVCQLEFMAILLSDQSSLDILKDVAQFLDEHLLRWIRRFAKCAAQRCENDFYATLAMLTAVYVDELRDLLANALDYPRPTEEEIETRMKMKKAKTAVSMQYIPGMAESW